MQRYACNGQNYDMENGIVNRCIGCLIKVNFTTDNEGHHHATSYVIKTNNTTGPALPHLENNQVAILADDTTLTFTHPHSHLQSTFRRTQLPITPVFALTAHKSQGNTVHAAILDIKSCLTIKATYVMLSKVKNSYNIHLLQPFHIKKIHTRCSQDL
jgi:hypothetical protein